MANLKDKRTGNGSSNPKNKGIKLLMNNPEARRAVIRLLNLRARRRIFSEARNSDDLKIVGRINLDDLDSHGHASTSSVRMAHSHLSDAGRNKVIVSRAGDKIHVRSSNDYFSYGLELSRQTIHEAANNALSQMNLDYGKQKRQ